MSVLYLCAPKCSRDWVAAFTSALPLFKIPFSFTQTLFYLAVCFFLTPAAPGKNGTCWAQCLNCLVSKLFSLEQCIDLIKRVCLQIPIHSRSSSDLPLMGGHPSQLFRELFSFFCKRSRNLLKTSVFSEEWGKTTVFNELGKRWRKPHYAH